MIAFIAALAQSTAAPAVPVTSPPPPVVAVPLPPPIIRTAPITPRPPRKPIMVRVRASAGSQILFADRLRVGPAAASFNQTRTEASIDLCASSYQSIVRNSFEFSIAPAFGNRENDYRLTFRWTRTPGEGCKGGQRTVSLEQVVTLESGRRQIVAGDAGLQLELTRE